MYKLLYSNRYHNGVTYEEGLNVDPLPFNPSGSCLPGGLYYTSLEHLPKWMDPSWPLIADVTLPADTLVYAEPCGTKWKANQLVLSNIRLLREFLAELDEQMVYQLVMKHDWLFPDVRNQSDALCLAAVRKNELMLKFVHSQTEEICLTAVQRNGNALKLVHDQTEAICLAAVRQKGWALEFVRDQTEAICMAAVQQHGCALQFVYVQTEALCLAAVREDAWALNYVQNQTEEICLAAVQQVGCTLRMVKNQTEAVCRAAVAQDPTAGHYVKISFDPLMEPLGVLSECDAMVVCHQCHGEIYFKRGKPLMVEPYEGGTLFPVCMSCIEDDELDHDTHEVLLFQPVAEVRRVQKMPLADTIKQAIAKLNG
jgi:hypothetical protein